MQSREAANEAAVGIRRVPIRYTRLIVTDGVTLLDRSGLNQSSCRPPELLMAPVPMDDQLVNMRIDSIADTHPCRLRFCLVLCLLAAARLHLLNASSTLCLHVFADVHSFGTK